MSYRFYLPGPWNEQAPLAISGNEAHHLLHVLRIPVGTEIIVFDGEGREADATVVETTRQAANVSLSNARDSWDRNEPPLALYCAIPKGERFDWLIEKSVEVGVTRFVPLRTTRGIVDPRSSKLERLRQVIVSAAKQSCRGQLMRLEEPVDFNDALNHAYVKGQSFLAQPSSSSTLTAAAGRDWHPDLERETCLFIGPEGGWTAAELHAAEEHHLLPISLGHAVLRIETAGIVASAIIRQKLSDLNSLMRETR